MNQTLRVRQGDCTTPVLYLFMVILFSETLEKYWIKEDLNMVNMRQQSHSPCNVGKLTGHKKKRFYQHTLLALFCVLYVDDGTFMFKDWDQLTWGLTQIYYHFKRFGLKMHVGKGKKAPETKCVFFLPPGCFGQKFNLSAKNSRGNRRMLVTKTRKESYKARHIREEIDYDDLPETRLIIAKDGFVTFCWQFKYIGSWIFFSLIEDHDIAKRLATANYSMGAMYTI